MWNKIRKSLNLFNMSFYKNQQKSVHFHSRTLFCFFLKNSVENNAKKLIIFSEKNKRKIRQKNGQKKTEKKLVQKSGQNSFKKVVKTRSKRKKREAEKTERKFDKKTKSLGITRVWKTKTKLLYI